MNLSHTEYSEEGSGIELHEADQRADATRAERRKNTCLQILLAVAIETVAPSIRARYAVGNGILVFRIFGNKEAAATMGCARGALSPAMLEPPADNARFGEHVLNLVVEIGLFFLRYVHGIHLRQRP
jgi:hypothetical protein